MSEVKYRSIQTNCTLRKTTTGHFIFYVTFTLITQIKKKQTNVFLLYITDDLLVECQLESNKISKIAMYVQLYLFYSE